MKIICFRDFKYRFTYSHFKILVFLLYFYKIIYAKISYDPENKKNSIQKITIYRDDKIVLNFH